MHNARRTSSNEKHRAESGFSTEKSSTRCNGESKKIVILGGGIAGLACARTLQGALLPSSPIVSDVGPTKAYDIVILEASNRLSGRLWTRIFAGAKVDAGAAWVHGTVGSPLTTLAEAANITLSETVPSNPWMNPTIGLKGSQFRIAENDGVRVLPESEIRAGNEVADALFNDIVQVAERLVAERSTPMTYGLADAVRSIISEDKRYLQAPLHIRTFLEIRLRLVEWWMGCSLTEMALDDWATNDSGMAIGETRYTTDDAKGEPKRPQKDMQAQRGRVVEASLLLERDGEYGDFPGPHCLPEDGMEQFSLWLANDSKLQQCVHLQQEAKIIRWKSSLSPLTDIQKNQRSCCVMTASGERFEADAVVVTLPVGVLQKQNNIDDQDYHASKLSVPAKDTLLQPGVRFIPQLPQWKRRAIGSLASGTYKKVWLEFAKEDVFWDLESPFIACIDPLSPISSQKSPLPQRPTYLEETDTVPLATVATDTMPPNSFSTSIDSAARASQRAALASAPHEALPAIQFMLIDNMYHTKGIPCLEVIFAGAEGRALFGLSDQDIIDVTLSRIRKSFRGSYVPDPLKYFITRWEEDPLSSGAYSYLPQGAAGSVERLAQPVLSDDGCGRIFFAGEATDANYQGCVHGAYLSGIRAAHEVLQYHGFVVDGTRTSSNHYASKSNTAFDTTDAWRCDETGVSLSTFNKASSSSSPHDPRKESQHLRESQSRL